MLKYIYCSPNEKYYRPRMDKTDGSIISFAKSCIDKNIYCYDRVEYEPNTDGEWRYTATKRRVKGADKIDLNTRLIISFYQTQQNKRNKVKTLYEGIIYNANWYHGTIGSDMSIGDNRIPNTEPIITCFNDPVIKTLRRNFNPETSNIVECIINVIWIKVRDYDAIDDNIVHRWINNKQRCQTFAELRPPPAYIFHE